MADAGRRTESAGAYEALVEAHSAPIWRLAFRLTGDRQEGEDLTQETFYEAWRSLPSLRDPSRGRAWLAAILLHRASRRLRRRRREPPVARPIDEESDRAPPAGPDLDRLARKEDLQRALDALDPDRRAAFLLVFHEGRTCLEAAELLGVPLGTVLSRVHRARLELRRRLRDLSEGIGERESRRGRDTGGHA